MAILPQGDYGDPADLRIKLLEELKKEVEKDLKDELKTDPFLKDDIKDFFKPEEFEIAKDLNKKLGYPKPVSHYRLVWESTNLAIEDVYFWFINFFSPTAQKIEKLRDVFSSSPNSSFFGSSMQRLGLNQDRVSSYLRTIGEMTNSAMTMARELRTVIELQEFYDKAGEDKSDKGKANSSEVVLRDMWVTRVEGGANNPASVIGLSSKIGFSILPDLFFGMWVDEDNFEKTISEMNVGNDKTKEVLKRKFQQYFVWKRNSKLENERRLRYSSTYLRQHYSIIRMYVSWLKPYLYYVRALQMVPQGLEKPELISSFENSLAELEILVIPKAKDKYMPCILITLNYLSKPDLVYTSPDRYHNGPKHIGSVEVNIRSYSWSKQQISMYKRLLQKEDERLLSFVDKELETSLAEVDSYLNDTLKETQVILEKAKGTSVEEKKEEETKEPKKRETRPLINLKELGDVIGFITDPFSSFEDKEKNKIKKDKSTKKSNGKKADSSAWLVYTLFKKSHRMLAW